MRDSKMHNLSRCNHVVRPIHGKPYMCPFPIYAKGLCTDHVKKLAPKKSDEVAVSYNIPKGYKSPFVELEMSLNELWKGEKKFLQQFHKPLKKTHRDAVAENLTGVIWNPDVPRETPDE